MHPLTEKVPKALLEICGRPFIFWQLELLATKGIRDVVVCVGHLGEMIQKEVGDGKMFGLSVKYSFDGTQLLGTGGAIRKALPLLGPEFFVTYGDTYLDCDWKEVLEAYRHHRMPALMTLFRNNNRHEKSNVLYRGGRIHTYDKKCPHKQAAHIDYGLGVYSSSVFFDIVPGDFSDLSDICNRISVRGILAGHEINQRFYEIGSPKGFADTEKYLRNNPASYKKPNLISKSGTL